MPATRLYGFRTLSKQLPLNVQADASEVLLQLLTMLRAEVWTDGVRMKLSDALATCMEKSSRGRSDIL